MPATSSTIPICTVTLPWVLDSYTLVLSTSTTYSPVILALRFRQKFIDYTATDYIKVQFKYYDNVLFLADTEVTGNITATILVNGVTTNLVVAVDNDTQLRIIGLDKLATSTGVA